jgi:predicted nucleotidyltransferase
VNDRFLYPNEDRLPHLGSELCRMFSQMPGVVRVIIFGSLARDEWDRWSDLDLLIITASADQFWPVFSQLVQLKPVLHHSFFTLRAEGDGAYVLGNVFVDESVFHCLDLNFLSFAQFQERDALHRFGPTRTLYRSDNTPYGFVSDAPQAPETLHDDPIEKRINDAMHFMKKALKKVLRQKATDSELRPLVDHLSTILKDYPEDIVVPRGHLGYLAHTYVKIAEALLGLADKSQQT